MAKQEAKMTSREAVEATLAVDKLRLERRERHDVLTAAKRLAEKRLREAQNAWADACNALAAHEADAVPWHTETYLAIGKEDLPEYRTRSDKLHLASTAAMKAAVATLKEKHGAEVIEALPYPWPPEIDLEFFQLIPDLRRAAEAAASEDAARD